MGEQAKILVTEDGQFDLSIYSWDDHRFSDILVKEHPIDTAQAMDISRFLREEIGKMELITITIPVIEKMIEAKLLEYGLSRPAPIRLDQSIFVKNGSGLSENAKRVLKKRYLKRDSDGNVVETPGQMFRRVAHHIAQAEVQYGGSADVAEVEEIFYDMMTESKFLPNSPTLMNAGRRLGQLAACFVLPVEDSMEGIFDALKNAALIHKSGGGTGFAFSRLRPKHSRVGTTGGVASGPVSFMRIFNTATEQVKQGGTRRGANMAILRVDHPDIIEFIYSKKDKHELNNFNISVGITDTFIEAVNDGRAYDLIDPCTRETVDKLDALEVYQALVKQAWENGDPGIVFLDRLNRDNPTPLLGEIESTNPCGEQPLLPLEACNLGSVNLAKFVVENGQGPVIDYEALRELVWHAVRFLDNAIDRSKYPLREIDDMVRGNRKIGLGVMGFADMLYQLNVAYNSEQALEVAEEVMSFVQEESHSASRQLGEERGAFKNFDKSVFKEREDVPCRNATTTTIAPTGTLSIIAGCSSGIEPLFALSFVRNVMDNDKLLEINPHFERVAKDGGFYSRELMDAIAAKGSLSGMEEIPTVEDVKKVYDLAYELGCKGVTIYRDGSKENQVLSFSENTEKEDGFMAAVKERPETLDGFTTRMVTGMGRLYVTVTEYERRPFEVFATIGKSGRSTTAKTEAIGRLVSLALRSGVKVEKVVEQLKGIGGEHPVFQNGGLVLSIPDAISRVLEKRYMDNGAHGNGGKQVNSLLGETCPECGQTISFEEGCMMCHFCGYTKCC
jgi:ribonucleoside-diphosphate reductase alpha chain